MPDAVLYELANWTSNLSKALGPAALLVCGLAKELLDRRTAAVQYEAHIDDLRSRLRDGG